MIEGARRIFRLSIGGLKCPLHIKFNYLDGETATNFVVELSFSERMTPIEKSYRCPDKIVYEPEMSKDNFTKSYLFIKAMAGNRPVRCRFTARFPKQDVLDLKDAEVRAARTADPDYDMKQQEL